MLLHEGLTHIHSQTRLHFGESFALTDIQAGKHSQQVKITPEQA